MSKANPNVALRALFAVEDAFLGSVGKALPPSDTVDHAVRFFGTWSGTDKLMMTTQYLAKLAIFYLNWRAERLFRMGLRAKPTSPSVEGLFKFAGTLSQARRATGLWGFLGIMKGLSALERNKPTSRLQVTLRRLQGISMLIFYPLEFMSFFSAPWAPVLAPRWISFQTGNKAALWSIRAWLVYVAAQVALLLQEQHAIASKEASESEKSTAAEGEEARIQREKTAKRKEQIMYQLVANVSRLPVIVHWSVEGGVYPYEILTTVLSLISALAAFGGGWENTRLPPPTSR